MVYTGEQRGTIDGLWSGIGWGEGEERQSFKLSRCRFNQAKEHGERLKDKCPHIFECGAVGSLSVESSPSKKRFAKHEKLE